MSEEKNLENKEPQEAPKEEQKQPEAPLTEIKEAPKEENPIISYMKTIDISKEETLTNKIKKILVGLKEKGLWDIGQKLPYEIQRAIANYVGAKNEYSVLYAVKQLQKEALKKPKQIPPTETEKFGLEIGGQPKEVKEKPPEEKPEEIKEEKQITTLQLSQDDFKALLTNINNTAKTMLKLENDIYPPDLINLLAFLDAKLFSNINVETQNITVNYNIILISAIALHLLPIIPILFTKPKEEKKEAEQK